MERTRALEWKQDKKYLDYIDSEKCFLSERQEGEEKAIMKNLRLKKVSIKDLDPDQGTVLETFGQLSEIWSDSAVEKEYISK